MNNAMIVPSNWPLPDEFRRRIGSSVGRQRTMHHESQLLIVAHLPPEPDEVTRRGLLFWRDAEGKWSASNGDPGTIAIKNHLDKFAKKLDEYELLEAKAQRSVDYLPLLDGLSPLSRTIRNFLEALEEARKSLPDDRNLIDHRDRAYELTRQAELLYTDARNSMDVAVVRRAEEHSLASHRMLVASHRLNILAAIFFPFATLGSIFGTTLTENWLWSRTPVPFLIFLALGTLAGVVLYTFVSKKAT